MDYYKNIDMIGSCALEDGLNISGVQYNVVTDLANEPVDVPFFKQHARIDYNVDDNLISAYLKAARQELEQWSQLSFGVKTMSLMATELPDNYRIMFGRVDKITTAGYDNFGDLFKEGGKDVDIEYTTKGVINETIKIAICRYAAGLYLNRENMVSQGQYSEESTRQNAKNLIDEAKKMVEPFMNKIMI